MKLAHKTKTDRSEQLRRNEQKWTRTLLAAGWTAFPSVILERQNALGLDPVDVNIVLHLARHWWYSDRLPYPSKRTLATCMNVNVSTIRRRIAKLEAAGFISREPRHDPSTGRQETNQYRLDGLIKAATPFAIEVVKEREARKAAAAMRLTRKKPRLAVVK